jgi:hypothetical protein
MYGNIKPADIDINKDVEIFYHYRPSMNIDDSNFTNYKQLDTSYLSTCSVDGGTTISGLFNLRLPVDKFSKKGIYTIYIRPKELRVNLADVGVLAAYPDVRGIVFNSSVLSDFRSANSLVGYRVEYLNASGHKTGEYKIITSSNLVISTSYNLGNVSDKSNKYYFSDSGSLIFCTVTPSVASTYKPNYFPEIGSQDETVVLVNTKFNPIMLEIEMVEHDEESIGTFLTGDQLIDKENALITTFNGKGEIIQQAEYGVYKDEYGTPLFEFKQERDNIDFTQNIKNF